MLQGQGGEDNIDEVLLVMAAGQFKEGEVVTCEHPLKREGGEGREGGSRGMEGEREGREGRAMKTAYKQEFQRASPSSSYCSHK